MDIREQLQQALGPTVQIEREIGAGGMSYVFLARDTSLNRDVVVKLLRPELMTRVAVDRFRREIDLVAGLQHPYIVPLLTAGAADGIPFYTMPYVRGESLRVPLSRGAMPVGEAIHILRAIASALAHAHAEGIVHRDIKPENVLLSAGVAVVTDFGVAKALQLSTARPDELLTDVGVTLGTPAYMSPEQAIADPGIDHRSDIYSLGCVAYEMLAGEVAGKGRFKPRPLATRAPHVPPTLADLVDRCLEQDPARRPQSAMEVIAALDQVATPPESRARRTRPLRRRTAVAAAVIVLAIAATGVWIGARGYSGYEVVGTRLISSESKLEIQPSLSPDGRFVAYAAGTPTRMQILVRQLNVGRSAIITDSTLAGVHLSPVWSPDGSVILFVAAGPNSAGSIQMVPAFGGTPRTVVDGAEALTPAWFPDGKRIVYTDGARLLVRDIDGETSRAIAAAPDPHSPVVSPDGRLIAFVSGNSLAPLNIASSAIMIVPAGGGTPWRITDSTRMNLSPAWRPDGRGLLFVSNAGGSSDLYEQRLDTQGRPHRAPRRLTTGLEVAHVSISRDGRQIAYSTMRRRMQVVAADLGAGAPDARPMRLITPDRQAIEGISLSPDGEWLAFDSDRSGNQDIYKMRIPGGEPVQLTRDSAPDTHPQWSVDGSSIAYYSQRGSSRDVRVMSADGTRDVAVTADAVHDVFPSLSPDGRRIVFGEGWPRAHRLVVMSRGEDGRWGERRVITTVATQPNATLSFPRWSPDGRWIATTRLADGEQTLIIVSPDGASEHAVTRASQIGEMRYLAWHPSATHLIVHTATPTGGSRFLAVSLSGGAPRALLTLPVGPRRQEFATDGRRIFITQSVDESDLWLMELRSSR